MIASMPPGLAHFAGVITAIAINALWEGALLVVCIWLLLRAWPGINAATRYIVWSATLVATVVVPVATTLPFLTPSSPTAVTAAAVRVPIPMVTHALTAVPSHGARYQSAEASRTGEASAAALSPPRLPERFRMTLPLPVVLGVLAIWTGLALVAFLRLGIGLFRLEQLKRDALPLPIEYRDAMARWTSAGKGRRDVRLCVSDEIDVPVAVGLFDAMILIPRSLLERLSESEVDQISLHELAHLRRADDWTNGVQRVAIALFGWNPAVLFVGQQLDLEREVACDDWVLAATGLVRPYATCLAKMAETSAWPYRPMAAPGVFATRKHISLRIERLLGAGRNAATSLSLGPAAVTVAVVGALAFAMQLVAPSVAAPLQAQPATHAVMVVVQREPVPVKTAETPLRTDVRPTPYVNVKTLTRTKEIYKYIRVLAAVTPEPLTGADPAVHVHMPGMKMQIPPTDVHVPRQTIVIPPVDVDVPAIENAFATGAMAAASKSVSAATRAAMAVAAPHGMHVADSSSVRNCNGCDMSGVNWSGRDMRGINLTGSDLSRANLSGTNFSNGTFNGVDFSGSNLRGASFRNARLTGCDFKRADLTGADFNGAVLTGCDFTKVQLTSSEARSILSTCTGCDFSDSNLSGLDLSNVHVNGVDFSHANLAGANLTGATFTGVDFSGARLIGAILRNAVFNGCDLGSVDLSHVDLSQARFIGTDFPGHESPKP